MMQRQPCGQVVPARHRLHAHRRVVGPLRDDVPSTGRVMPHRLDPRGRVVAPTRHRLDTYRRIVEVFAPNGRETP